MSNNRTQASFFSGAKEWTPWKNKILADYLDIWTAKLGRYHNVLVFVDGCAGEGLYNDGTKGSPLLAASLNHEKLNARGVKLMVVAFEQDRDSYPRLVAAMDPFTRAGLAAIYNEKFTEGLADVATVVRDYPTLYFIDPYGMKDLTPSDLGPILGDHSQKKELLMRVDLKMFNRWAGWLDENPRDAREAKLARGFRTLLSRFDFEPDELADEQDAAAELMTREYLDVFKERFAYMQLIPIRAKHDGAAKYHLLFGTDNAHGAAYMNDVVCRTEDAIWQRSVSKVEIASGQSNLFELPRPKEHLQSSLDSYIVEVLAAIGPTLPWVEIRAELAMTFGSSFRGNPHHNAAAKRLKEKGTIRFDGALKDSTPVTLV